VRPAFSIRQATERDAAGILACLHSAFEPYRHDYTPEGFADTTLTRDSIDRRLASMSLLVAATEAREGDIVGTVAYQVYSDAEAHLRGMAVLPDWQGCGVASRLLATVESLLRTGNCTRITLDTTAPLQRAIRFYERNGFRRSGRVGDFFGMPLYEYVKILSPL
jgi:GNAT superfamily N-acetyltransferase